MTEYTPAALADEVFRDMVLNGHWKRYYPQIFPTLAGGEPFTIYIRDLSAQTQDLIANLQIEDFKRVIREAAIRYIVECTGQRRPAVVITKPKVAFCHHVETETACHEKHIVAGAFAA